MTNSEKLDNVLRGPVFSFAHVYPRTVFQLDLGALCGATQIDNGKLFLSRDEAVRLRDVLAIATEWGLLPEPTEGSK